MMCKDRIPFNESRSQVYQPMGASLNSCYVHYEKPGLRSWHKNWARIGKNAEAQLELYSILTQGEDVIIHSTQRFLKEENIQERWVRQ